MSVNTNLPGRLRNTDLPVTHGLLPLFEAVVNSIHAIEEAHLPPASGRIVVEILRSPQNQLGFADGKKKPGPPASRDIIGFKIIDNGIGFDDTNMTSFETLDSEHKASKGARGIGRLLWLKAFARASIESIYQDGSTNGGQKDTSLAKRTFFFDAQAGVSEPSVEPVPLGTQRSTSVHLTGFAQRYRDSSLKTAASIADALLEHCLWYFVRQGGPPHILISDGDDSILLDNVYDAHMHSSAQTESLSLKGIPFDLLHIRLRAHVSQSHVFALCAMKQLVITERLAGKIPGLHGRIPHEDGDFVYACYVSSPFLDERVRAERTGGFNSETPH